MELNPNHPMTAAMHDNWHKIVALLMLKAGQKHVEISIDDVEQLVKNPSAVAVKAKGEKIMLDLIPLAEAEQLTRKERGLSH